MQDDKGRGGILREERGAAYEKRASLDKGNRGEDGFLLYAEGDGTACRRRRHTL